VEKQLRHSVKALNLPSQHTPFFGRTNEIVDVSNLLIDPACQLLTLTGPGGIGKTRLAIQAVTEMLDNGPASQGEIFTDGVYFVPLQSVHSSDYLVSTVADAVNLYLAGQEDPVVQLLNHLHGKHMLLILDNFEQLLTPPSLPPLGGERGGVPPQGKTNGSLASEVETASSLSPLSKVGARASVDLLGEFFMATPGVKLLVTSREALNLQEEWLYHVQGMSFPELPPDPAIDGAQVWEEIEVHGAVRLFSERARRVRQDFSLADEGADVVRICQLVEGMPLAIELAASWTKILPCSVIAAEIERNIDFLTTNFRDVPDRQRSVRAVFDQSWQLLTEKERAAFKRLSVFRGSFDHEAAAWVAGASLSTLSALIDKSLLRPGIDGRYQIHELLRQYSALKLAQSPKAVARVYDLHAAYYAEFLSKIWEDLGNTRQREAIDEIKAELENIRAAWEWAVGMGKVEDMHKASHSLSWFYQYQSRYLEGANAYERAVASLMREDATEQTDLALAAILVNLAWFNIRLGRLEQAEAVTTQSRDIYRRLNALPEQGRATDPLLPLGIIASIRGDYAAAAQLGEEARRASEKHHDDGNLPFALYVLAGASLAQGEFESAREYAQQACGIVERTSDRWFMAYCLNELGNVASALGDFTEAEQHYKTSYAIRQEFNDPEGMALALNHLGKMAILQDDYKGAEQLYRRSLAVYQQINDRGGLATSLNGLGTTACALGNYQVARQNFREALQIATDIQYKPLILSILIGIGESMLRTGHEGRGIELLAFVQGHPATDRETKNRAQECLNRYQAELPPDTFASTIERGKTGDLESLTAALQIELETLEPTPEITPPAQPTEQPLVEPLTARELEVLQLIADGLTNQQIAEELILSVGTVKFYTGQIYGKLQVHSRTQAVARGRELNMLS
jgi:predicted ATPase/DNA-binding CsgD family transcriptional regulator